MHRITHGFPSINRAHACVPGFPSDFRSRVSGFRQAIVGPVMIPHRLIFIWFGRSFPYGNLLALRSARKGFTPDEVLLIVDDPDMVMSTLEDVAPDIRQSTLR